MPPEICKVSVLAPVFLIFKIKITLSQEFKQQVIIRMHKGKTYISMGVLSLILKNKIVWRSLQLNVFCKVWVFCVFFFLFCFSLFLNCCEGELLFDQPDEICQLPLCQHSVLGVLVTTHCP